MSNSTKMTTNELTNVFSLVRELTNAETLNSSFYFPEIVFCDSSKELSGENYIYVGENVNYQKVYIHIVSVLDATKALLEISASNLQMLQNFYIPTLDVAKKLYNQYANDIYEFYTDHAK